MTETGWVSISRYGEIHGVHRKTVYKWLDSGLLETYRVGRCIRVKNQPPLLTKRTPVTKSRDLRKPKARGKIVPHNP